MKKKHRSLLSRKDKEARRFKAGKMFQKGISQADIARKLKVTPAAVKYWHDAWEKRGMEGLKSKGHPGFVSRLTEKNRKKLKRIILRGAAKYGYSTDFWTLPRIAAVIKKEFKISFSGVWVWKIVLSLGFTCQKPQLRHKERNEKSIAEWLTKTLPGLKKMGSNTWILAGISR